MANIPELYERVRSGVANIVAVRNEERVASGTGFIVFGKLVTCAHVIDTLPADCDVLIQFGQADSDGLNKPYRFTRNEIRSCIKGHSEERYYDYAIIDLEIDFSARHNFSFASENAVIGENVVILGYPFDFERLTCHSGIMSSVYESGVATMLQLDMSVNASNSGGPLMKACSGEVVGVVSRKATGLSRMLDDLMANFDANIFALQDLGGLLLGGIDLIQKIRNIQIQMRSISLEIKRSLNVGIGYAIRSDALMSEPALS